jgi:large subunit ribosomal protein L21
MYAVVETGGKQYKVSEGDMISVEKIKASEGDKVVLDKVLLYSDGNELKVGAPYVDGAKVEADVVENGKGKKIVIFKFKAKKDYRKKQGHRQPYTMLKVSSIALD